MDTEYIEQKKKEAQNYMWQRHAASATNLIILDSGVGVVMGKARQSSIIISVTNNAWHEELYSPLENIKQQWRKIEDNMGTEAVHALFTPPKYPEIEDYEVSDSMPDLGLELDGSGWKKFFLTGNILWFLEGTWHTNWPYGIRLKKEDLEYVYPIFKRNGKPPTSGRYKSGAAKLSSYRFTQTPYTGCSQTPYMAWLKFYGALPSMNDEPLLEDAKYKEYFQRPFSE
jgi:hypothetical protein